MKKRVKIDIVTEGAPGGDKHIVVEFEDLDKDLATASADLETIVDYALEHCDDAHALTHDELLAAVAKAGASK